METHPLTDLFPMLPAPELADMAESIRQEGLLNPCVRQGDVLLDGRNRLAACELAGVEPRFVEYQGDSPVSFIIASNLARRHLDKGQKVALALDIEPHFAEENAKKRGQRNDLAENVPPSSEKRRPRGGQSRDLAAAAVGVSGKLVSTAKAIQAADPERFEQVKQGKLSIAKANKEIKAEQDKRDLAAAQEAITEEKRKSIESVCDLRHCTCADLFASGIRPDAVITDPPYAKEFLPVFTELAKGCKAAGVPLVAVMSGQSYLPEVMRRLCEHLRYRWTLAYMTPGGSCRVWPLKIDCQWKPTILFGDVLEDVIFDVVHSNRSDKRFHEWGQSSSGMADLVERLTKPGEVVCDPFLGGGTTAAVSLELGRRFVGCDVDEENVEKTKRRVMA